MRFIKSRLLSRHTALTKYAIIFCKKHVLFIDKTRVMLYNIICITIFQNCIILGVALSYRNDLNAYRAQREKIKKIAVNAAKITVIILAVLFVATTVMVIVDLTSEDTGYTAEGGEGGVTGTPTITVPTTDGKLYVYVGEPVTWRTLVRVSDNCTLSVDNSQVNISEPGVYTVKYTATNASGKSTTLEVTVIVTKPEYSYYEMEKKFKQKAEELGITSNMSKKEMVLAVYNFVNDPSEKDKDKANIVFKNESNSDRDDWENDWIEEAMLAVGDEGSYQGDCYTYYSVSKAFFTVLGIEHVGIERDPSSSEEGTHFWMMVNIGEGKDEQWYYYDATRLAGTFDDGTNNGCLMTLSKLQSYRTSKGGSEFYKFDPTEYPTAETAKVN